MKTNATEMRREMEGIQTHQFKRTAQLNGEGVGFDDSGTVKIVSSNFVEKSEREENQIAVEVLARFISEISSSRKPLLMLDVYKYAFGMSERTTEDIGKRHGCKKQYVARLVGQLLARFQIHKSRAMQQHEQSKVVLFDTNPQAHLNTLNQSLTSRRISLMSLELRVAIKSQLERLADRCA